MKPWHARPQEVANLLNPAFCGEILRRSISKYNDHSTSNINYSLIFLILPIILHKYTREKINTRSRKSFHTWVEENPEIKIDFAKRAEQLIPITKETIIFLINHEALTIKEDGTLVLTNYVKRNISVDQYGEVAEIFKKSEKLGKWFAETGNPVAIYTILGVTL